MYKKKLRKGKNEKETTIKDRDFNIHNGTFCNCNACCRSGRDRKDNRYLSSAKTQTDFEHNQTAIKFLSYCNKEDYKTWDQSLGTMTDAEAKEIQACVDEITKNEKRIIKKQS